MPKIKTLLKESLTEQVTALCLFFPHNELQRGGFKCM